MEKIRDDGPAGLPADNPPAERRDSLHYLICTSLGYCCEWKFFSLYHSTSLIAARLGVSPRAVRLHKAQARDGQLRCEGCPNCMLAAGRRS